ncbi:MAG: galactokinase [Tepidisphaeraceae bacterium]
MDTASLREQFVKAFGPGAEPRIIRAPGRVNLIGEHTDYNDGFVFPMAIEPQVLFVCRPRGDKKVVVRSSLFPDSVGEFSIDQVSRGEPKWTNYVRGPIAMLKEKQVPLVGMDCLIVNTLPPGGGLSSSAAMEVGTTRAMLALAGQDLPLREIALLSQKAEHEYADVPCGLMDQMIVTAGRRGTAMLFDCRDFSQTFIPLDPSALSVVIINSMVKHELSGGEYAERRQQCERGVAHFQTLRPGIKALRDVTPAQVAAAQGALDDVVFRRCRHVVNENERCQQFAKLLSAGKFEDAGQLMVQSHNSLRDDYEVSTPELDFLVETAMKTAGVYGSRMTGGGFGGCTVSLVKPEAAEAFMKEVTKAYKAKLNVDPVAFITNATDGAGVVL